MQSQGAAPSLKDADNLVTALYSHHLYILQKKMRNEKLTENDLQPYQLIRWLDEEHQNKLATLMDNTHITRIDQPIEQMKILDTIIKYIREEIELTKLFATLGQRNLPAVIEMLDQPSRDELLRYVEKRFYKRHLLTLSISTAKHSLPTNATAALTIGGAALFIFGTGFLSPIILLAGAGVASAGVSQVKHNLSTMYRCLLIARALGINLVEHTQNNASPKTTTANNERKVNGKLSLNSKDHKELSIHSFFKIPVEESSNSENKVDNTNWFKKIPGFKYFS